MDIKKELLEMGVNAWDDRRQPYDDDFEPIDYSFSDGEDNVAWLWGSHPTDDVQCECNHPEQCMEWGDDDERGFCRLCGAECDWHYETSADDGYEIKERVPDTWYIPKKIGGVLGKYLKELAREW